MAVPPTEPTSSTLAASESLHRDNDTQAVRMVPLLAPIDFTLVLKERSHAFVAQHAGKLEWITPVRRALLWQEPFSVELRNRKCRLLLACPRETLGRFSPNQPVQE